MKPTNDIAAVIDRKRYAVATATVLAGNDWWDGNGYDRCGTNQFLYRTPNGRYFFVYLTCHEGECDTIEPCGIDEAVEFYESTRDECQYTDYADAFPDVEVQEA